MYIGVKILYKHDENPIPESKWHRVEECRKSPTGQHDAPDERHFSETSQGSPVGPSHRGTEREEGEWEDQK